MHFKLKKQHIFFILIAALSLLCVLLTACGQEKEQLVATAPEYSSQSAATPAPSHSPRVDVKETVVINGEEVTCYADPANENINYVLLNDAMDALGAVATIDKNTKRYTFTWRDQVCSLTKDDPTLIYGDKTYTMEEVPFVYKGSENLYIPVKSFCEGLEIGTLYDDVNYRLYCTPGAGNWELPSGKTVPVIMHYAVGYEEVGIDLYTDLDQLDRELQYLSGNGYTFCWFDDLWDLDNIEKPVILCFDDGWLSHYTYLISLITKYNAKITEFLVAGNINSSDESLNTRLYMNTNELQKLLDTDLVSVQSHSMNDPKNFLGEKDFQIRSEVVDTKLFITRLTGKEPIAYAYPNGDYNDTILELVNDNFRFGLTSGDSDCVWITGETDNLLIPRFYPPRGLAQSDFAKFMEQGYLVTY